MFINSILTFALNPLSSPPNTQQNETIYSISTHFIIEGEVVCIVQDANFFNGEKWIPMRKGKLQLQSEAAETYFKHINIRPISRLEDKYNKYLK